MNPETQQIEHMVEMALDETVHIAIQVTVYAIGLIAQAIQNWRT